jgi:hypothetical protein
LHDAIARADKTLGRLASANASARRTEPRPRSATRSQRQREERERTAQQPALVPRVPRAPARDWQAEEKWIRGIIHRQLEAFAEALGEDVAKILNERLVKQRQQRAELEDRVTKSEAATVELLLQLEKRIGDVEQRAVLRPVRPTLVIDADTGGSDAA